MLTEATNLIAHLSIIKRVLTKDAEEIYLNELQVILIVKFISMTSGSGYAIMHRLRMHTKSRDTTNESQLVTLQKKGMIKIGSKPDGTAGKTYQLTNRAVLFLNRIEPHLEAIAGGYYDYQTLKILL